MDTLDTLTDQLLAGALARSGLTVIDFVFGATQLVEALDRVSAAAPATAGAR